MSTRGAYRAPRLLDAPVTYLRVKNLSKHQHYKDRRPPWIKLHAEVLDDYAFACLQDASKVHLMLIWVLASRMDNRIPNDPAWIARKINATETVDVDALVSAGFIEVCGEDGGPASAPLASRKQTAMPETEAETEAETEKDLGASGDAPSQSDDLPADFAACWADYPRRPNDSRKKALKAWQARVRAGVEPTTLLEGARRYARYCDLTGKTGSEFVKQAATFFGPDEHYLLSWEPESSAARPAGAVPATSEADDLLAAMEGAGLVVAYSGPREVYRERIAALGEQLGRPAEEFRALVSQVKPWDLARITFAPDRRREFARRLAAAPAKAAA